MSEYPKHIVVDGLTIQVATAEEEARWTTPASTSDAPLEAAEEPMVTPDAAPAADPESEPEAEPESAPDADPPKAKAKKGKG